MATRLTLSALKGVPRETFVHEVEAELAKRTMPVGSPWVSRAWEPAPPKEYIGVWRDDVVCIAPDSWTVAETLSRRYGCPWLELRIQEGDHWDMTACVAGEVVADFSTRVAAFDHDGTRPRPWKAGNLDKFVAAWGVPARLVQPYLVDWDAAGPGRAFLDDKHERGDCFQLMDFMRAIGVEDPYGHPERFTFHGPDFRAVYRPLPLWRRFVRQMSVWTRGVNPDVPRMSRGQRKLWRQRRAAIRLVRIK